MGVRIQVFAAQSIAEALQASTPKRIEIADAAAGIAIATAPRLTGEYAGGVGVEVSGAQVDLVNDDPEAIYKEYGTSDTPAHATMTNAARQFGRYEGMTPRR